MARALAKLPRVDLGSFRPARFPNQEMYVTLGASVTGEDCCCLASIAPPDERLLKTLLLADTLKKEGARRVIAILPYMAYTRQDKRVTGKSLATATVGQLLQAAGIDEVITVDLHSPAAGELFPIPVTSLSPAPVFARTVLDLSLQFATFVAPDEGALGRCRDVMSAAGAGGTLAYLKKERRARGIAHLSLHGDVTQKAVIIDDILDTGGTLISACRQLRLSGARHIHVMVTHGLFTGTAWQQLWHLGVRRIYCTDTTPKPKGISRRIVRLSVIPQLLQALERKLTA
ncbi:MAG: ribose-phosphate pyrophosphokinase [Chloroflexi bacterium]|nr:ribose-phosphate pyrophosphokinase [Chloroflexota bacterium]